jgi:hypothetical protein
MEQHATDGPPELKHIVARHFGWLTLQRMVLIGAAVSFMGSGHDVYLERVKPTYPNWRHEAQRHPVRANFSNAGLSGADLTRALLIDANLTGARLSEADLKGAFLYAADLTEAELFSADLSHANLSHANLTDTFLLAGKEHACNRLTMVAAKRSLAVKAGESEPRRPKIGPILVKASLKLPAS